MSTVILGGGIIGLSTAYYLSQAQPEKQSVHSINGTRQESPEIHIVDSAPELLMSASGFAGGFLALDWFAPPVCSLGALSFQLHRDLAAKHDGQRRWGYAGSHTYSLSTDERGVTKGERHKKESRGEHWVFEGTSRANAVGQNSYDDASVITMAVGEGAHRDEVLNDDGTPAWITPQVDGTISTIASPDECGQIEPRELCEFLISECEARGVKFHLASAATEILVGESGELEGLKVRRTGTTTEEDSVSTTIKSTKLLLCAGAWTPRVFKNLFSNSKLSIPISPLAGYSVTVRSPRYKKPFINHSRRDMPSPPNETGDPWLCYSIYCPPTPHWPTYCPEAYARLARNGETEIWIGGINDATLPLPDNVTDVKALADPEQAKILRATLVQLTGKSKQGQELHEDDLETIREALCFRPATRTGRPIITKLTEKDLGGIKTASNGGVFVASGHGPWGITLSLGTGLVMSELIQGKKPSADIDALGLR